MLGQRLQYLRSNRKKTQEDIAKIIGITRPAYTAYEKGKRKPDYDTLTKIAEFYDVSTDYLLGRVNDPEPQKITGADLQREAGEHGIDMFFYNQADWDNLTEQDIEELRNHFKWVVEKRKQMDEEAKKKGE
ncbi:helix-turn-helix transcriptional regulator [Paenalkalicoccus suaedae]|uniref:Helix-turn-helix transcriptional regulator n=1 Tax=Paenalkalicoccus suaedae TaxID=2592382 RepID=A0A859FH11_9BACI|nr:helix-turn-helix transcriptional regulator [Paenalkalicoccus suaedae]QKS71942.1 helix-turn-helix transcriptional regulator [Paenalkalicoccus suaedae]